METVLNRQKTKRKGKKIMIWSAAALLVLIVAAVIAGNLFLSKGLPKTEGSLTLSGLQTQVSVTRDASGIPHVYAKSDHDLYMAQGYIQAQDRLFQMDLSRRQASGRLSEVIGKAMVDKDKFFRTIGLRRAAAASYDAYTQEGKDILGWFAEGVNLYMKEAESKGKLPVEFSILGYKPEPWSPVDSLTIGKYMAFDLGGNWEDQAFRQYLLQNFPKEKAYDLFPSYPKDAPYIISKSDLDIGKSFAGAIIPPELNGSNNWVVSGKKTKSGKPLLADDPHLALATPAIWYQMELKSPSVHVSGVIFAGIPGIILGHNEQIAWGVTNTGPDVQDLYIEKRSDTNPTEFLYNHKWEKAEIISEPIKIKKAKTIDYDVTVTRHGPVISEFAGKSGSGQALALRWTALDPSAELEAIINMNKADSWNAFEKALEKFRTPAQNFVFASKDGTIAYKANGNIPIRKKGDSMLPVPGWNDEYEWKGFIPFDELPRLVNPTEGFISTANNKVISDDYPYHISHNWAQPYRQMRIQEVLKKNPSLEAKHMKELQSDVKNLQAKEFVPLFLKTLEGSKDKEVSNALKILGKWDYQDKKDQAAPLIFNLWINQIQAILFEKQIPEDTFKLFNGRKQAVDQLLRRALEGNPGPWINEQGGIKLVLEKSLKATLHDIQKEQGKKMGDWSWGDFHKIYFNHPLSAVSPLNFIFNSQGGIPANGSGVTVQAAGFEPEGTVDHGASWRFVADLNDLSKSYQLVGPGQSGHVKSKWYHDQMEDWVKGNYHTTYLNEKRGETLVLKP
ncbi:penicillin acylase family protein [Bacillus testis]|uniref:penicillin acylase family protein n=1 Tax=Bacillus testis TaxID=1622072 RepID=UPI00067EB968|nr:penicillin acylase family protein [Bacillus testis]